MVRRNRGFTLIELLCVLSLIVIAAAIALPAFSNPLQTAKLKSDARQLTWVIRSCRQDAITTGAAKTIKFYTNDSENQKYKVVGGDTCSLSQGVFFVGTTTFSTTLGGCKTCICYSSGACSGGTVTLSNGDRRLYVIVNPISGRVRISDEPPW
ncbi:MAG: prepilin-type N-terminal cleavage/methylation domain-containing protein [Bacillota bacterium]|nr:prepilin-type N-terminal cleavage/methylation domain-containing protein [Bacillota bacterium]